MSHQSGDLVPIGKVVEELSTDYPDVTHSSLRFLENEGLARPTRTPGGHRLYGPEDIARIRQIKAWQRQHLSLSEIRERLEAADRIDNPQEIAWRFLDLAAAGDLPAAQAVVLELWDFGFSLQRIFQHVLTPALIELGRRWQDGELLVGQEKEISALSRDLIAELSVPGRQRATPQQDPRRGLRRGRVSRARPAYDRWADPVSRLRGALSRAECPATLPA